MYIVPLITQSISQSNNVASLKPFCHNDFGGKSILTAYSSSEIPTTVPFPALPKTALWREFLRFPPRLASLDSRRRGSGESGGEKSILPTYCSKESQSPPGSPFRRPGSCPRQRAASARRIKRAAGHPPDKKGLAKRAVPQYNDKWLCADFNSDRQTE